MSYEQFREQCAAACEQVDALWAVGSDSRERATPEDCAAAVRALPLPDVRLSIGNTFNERVLNVLGETWNLVSFPLEQPFRAQARSEIMRLMTEIVSMRNEPTIEELRAENEQIHRRIAELQEVLELAKNGLQWYQDMHPDELNETDYETMALIDTLLKGDAE